MAQHRRRNSGLRGFIVLVLVTVIGGAALHVTGNLSNPFEYTSLLLQTPPLEADDSFQMILIDTASSDNAVPQERPDGIPDRDERSSVPSSLADYVSFSWEDFGNVLYNLWVMFALTIVVILVARPVGWLVKRYKQARQQQTV